MKAGKVIFGLLVSGVAGAALGILFAPNKGSVTRKKITKKKDEILDEIEEKYHAVIDAINTKYESLNGFAAKETEKVGEKANEVLGSKRSKP